MTTSTLQAGASVQVGGDGGAAVRGLSVARTGKLLLTHSADNVVRCWTVGDGGALSPAREFKNAANRLHWYGVLPVHTGQSSQRQTCTLCASKKRAGESQKGGGGFERRWSKANRLCSAAYQCRRGASAIRLHTSCAKLGDSPQTRRTQTGVWLSAPNSRFAFVIRARALKEGVLDEEPYSSAASQRC